MAFAIHWHESAMDLHVFPILIPPPTTLSIPSLWVFPVHQPWALVSWIQPGLVICFTLDSILVSMLFSQNIPPSLFNTLSRLVITFLLRSKRLLISWLQSPSSVILDPPKIKSDTVSTVSPSICHEVMGLDAVILVFWMLSFKPTFHSPLSLSSRGFLVSLKYDKFVLFP